MRAKRIEVMSADRVLLFTVAVMSGYISITRFCLSDCLRFRINQNYILSNYLKPCCMFGCLPVCENVLFCFFLSSMLCEFRGKESSSGLFVIMCHTK